jgi:hypothetical protein
MVDDADIVFQRAARRCDSPLHGPGGHAVAHAIDPGHRRIGAKQREGSGHGSTTSSAGLVSGAPARGILAAGTAAPRRGAVAAASGAGAGAGAREAWRGAGGGGGN